MGFSWWAGPLSRAEKEAKPPPRSYTPSAAIPFFARKGWPHAEVAGSSKPGTAHLSGVPIP